MSLDKKLQDALSIRNWALVESLILGTNTHILNYALCMSLESIWFLNTCQELNGLTTLIKKIISNGANDFMRAAFRMSFLASCVTACQSGSMSLTEAVTFVSERLQDYIKECNDTELKAAGDEILKFTKWAMDCIRVHQGNNDSKMQINLSEVRFQLSACRTFLDLAKNRLTLRDFTDAFNVACLPLTLLSCSFDPGWASGTSAAAAIRGLLNILAVRGADSVNKHVLVAARFGSTEIMSMLLQIARWNRLPVDVNLALSLASDRSRFGMMEWLVDEGQASSFLDPLVNAVERGCIPVVSWFVNRGCTDVVLCQALIAAASSNQLAAIAYLLSKVPNHMLTTFGIDILKISAERCGGGSLDGVAFLLSSDFMGSQGATYGVADHFTLGSNNGAVVPGLVKLLRDNWSVGAFYEGLREAEEHYVNIIRVLRNEGSGIRLRDLPKGLVIAIALTPLYRECSKAKGRLLPQRLRGELVGVVRRLGYREAGEGSRKEKLMAVLERHLPSFLTQS